MQQRECNALVSSGAALNNRRQARRPLEVHRLPLSCHAATDGEKNDRWSCCRLHGPSAPCRHPGPAQVTVLPEAKRLQCWTMMLL